MIFTLFWLLRFLVTQMRNLYTWDIPIKATEEYILGREMAARVHTQMADSMPRV